MALVKCEHCGEQIAGNAEHCPKCGGIYTRKGWKRSDIISAIQATISGISAIIALGVLTYYFSQYRTTENWKKREFVATQIKEFHSDKINEAVLLMLDYDPARALLHEVPVGLYAVVVRCSFATQFCGSAGGKELGPYGHRCREGY